MKTTSNNSPTAGGTLFQSRNFGHKTTMRIERRSFQPGLFDFQERERDPAEMWRPPDWINEVVDWEIFRLFPNGQLEYGKSTGPRQPRKEPLLMLKRSVLQDLQRLSGEETEF